MKKRRAFRLGALLLALVMLATACSSGGESIDTKSKNADQINPDKLVDAPFEGWVEGLPKIQAPEGFDWQQFKGNE